MMQTVKLHVRLLHPGSDTVASGLGFRLFIVRQPHPDMFSSILSVPCCQMLVAAQARHCQALAARLFRGCQARSSGLSDGGNLPDSCASRKTMNSECRGGHGPGPATAIPNKLTASRGPDSCTAFGLQSRCRMPPEH